MTESLGENRLSSAVQGPTGIGGWLLLPIFHLFLDAFIVLVGILDTVSRRSAPTEAGQVASAAFTLLSIFIGIFAVYCVVHIFKKKRDVPLLMSWFYPLIFGKLAASAALMNYFPEIQLSQAFRASIGSVFGAAAAAGIWISYFKQSVRVRNTFVN